MTPVNRPPHSQAGMTLIEVLVALLIFSFGLLGFVGLQARAIQYSVSAENSNLAALLANEMASTIELAGSPITMSSTTMSTAISNWQTRVQHASGLPNAAGTVVPLGTNGATITVQWQPPATASTSTAKNQYVTQVIVP